MNTQKKKPVFYGLEWWLSRFFRIIWILSAQLWWINRLSLCPIKWRCKHYNKLGRRPPPRKEMLSKWILLYKWHRSFYSIAFEIPQESSLPRRWCTSWRWSLISFLCYWPCDDSFLSSIWGGFLPWYWQYWCCRLRNWEILFLECSFKSWNRWWHLPWSF